MAVTAETEPVVLYQAALLVRADSWDSVLDTLEAVGAVVTELPPASSRARRFDVSMPPPVPKQASPVAVLTSRELEMLERLARGLSAQEIGAELFLTYNTVKTHIRNMFRKLGCGDRAHAVAIAYQRGILGGAS